MAGTSKNGGNLEERVGSFDSLTNAIRDFSNSPAYKTLVSELNKQADAYFHEKKDTKTGDLILDETKARELADKLWAFAAEHIAKHYLKMEDKEAEVKKNTKDPSTGESVYDTVITSVLGVDKDAYFNNLKTRGTVDPTQISTLVAPLYETHQRTDTTKRTSKSIKDNKDADLGLAYLKKLKDKYPEALKPLNIPSRYASVEEVRGLIVTAASAIPRDYPINIAESYKKAA